MAKASLLLVFLLILSISLGYSSTSSDDPACQNNDELQALLTIKQDWGNPTALSSWKVKNHSSSIPSPSAFCSPCKWVGVTCNDDGQVTALSFQNFQIIGPIPASICNLKNLSYIDFSYNNLTREFPTALYSCSALQYLDLSNNGFSGALPDDISKLSSAMEHLNLSSNGFTGSVPLAIAGFPKLKSLVLDTNGFEGRYPAAAIGNLTELETLTLASNPFAPGTVPHEFGNLTKLQMLWMSGMNLTGGIPEALSSLPELTWLDLSQNKLQGDIPRWVWKHQKLQILYLYANRFTGGIGPDITAVSMRELDVSANLLTEPIPESIGSMKNLTLLFFYFNNIRGQIPRSVGMLPKLRDLRIFNNMLTGTLPPELGKHSPLGNLEAPNNFLSGEIPDTLCFNQKLYDIVLFNNSFSGVFPASLGECTTLGNIMVQDNNFTGEFPGSVWSEFPGLTTVMIQNNEFIGLLPPVVSSNITRIEMGNNKFSGALPASATGLKAFKAENNWFSHGLPADMSKFASLTDLSLAGNELSGSIPESIVALELLSALNLSSTKISGVIPASIGQLPMLNILDLSNNNLVGEIPVTFDNIDHPLFFLNLSYNQLTGMVPATLQVTTFNGSFLGNRGLCTGRLDSASGLPLQLCPGDEGHSSSSTRRRILVAVVVTSSVALLVGFLAAVGWLVVRRKKQQRDVTSWKMVPFRQLDFTVHDVLSKISEENMIGRGGSGKVYLIHLDGCRKSEHGGGGDEAAAISHSMVAVKKIGNAGKPDASLDKEFEAEVTVLCGLRHGNIINLLCCISGGDTKLLVYEYMENGSLDRWLHRRRDSGPLDWPTRLRVAVDVARGLGYMHHDFTRPVIHRDVKCSNILLDCGFRAKIADFGLARILAKAGESEAASAVCGTFGYIAPEYVNRAKVSDKVDVYSFGVVLLELATGRGPQDGGTESGSCLAKWAATRYKDGPDRCADLVDGEIKDAAYLDDMVAVFELGVACTAEDPASRPPMSEVLHRLLQCDRSYGTLGDDDDVDKDLCDGVKPLECVVEMATRT